MAEGLLKGLSEEQIARVRACKNTDELLNVAKEEGIELTNDQLAAVAGGNCTGTSTRIREGQIVCPRCHRGNCKGYWDYQGPVDKYEYYCRDCYYTFDTPYKG